MGNELSQVTKDQFWATVGPLDAVIALTGQHPYTSHFSLRYGGLIGRITGENSGRSYFLTAQYAKRAA